MHPQNVTILHEAQQVTPSTSLEDLAGVRIWAARGAVLGKAKRKPINPWTGGDASSAIPATWGTRGAAEQRAETLPYPELRGVGVMISDRGAPEGWTLAGLDLDGCRNPATGAIEGWAEPIVERFATYCEVSPSGTGLRLLFWARKADVAALRAEGLVEHSKPFARAEHVEIKLAVSRQYLSITGQLHTGFLGQFDRIEAVLLADMHWLLSDYAPAWKAAGQSDSGDASGSTGDDSGSADGFRVALRWRREGLTDEEIVERFENDDGTAGDWWRRTDDRNRARALERPAAKVIAEEKALIDKFEVVAGADDDEPRKKLGLHALDDEGVISAFTEHHQGELRFDHHAGAWFQFNGHTWKVQETRLAAHFARVLSTRLAARDPKAGKALRRVSSWEAVERGARTVPALACTSDTWNADPMILGTPGGLVDLRTGELRDGLPGDMVSKTTAVTPIPLDRFDPALDCPRWLAFLDESLGGDADVIRFVQQWAGYGLTGMTTEERLLFVFGGGGNGKSVLINTLAQIVGEYAVAIDSGTLTARKHQAHKEELARLHGPRFAYASEVERDARWAEVRIKQLTGGDQVTANFMRQNSFNFRPQLTLTVFGNDRPSLSNVDDAIRRRFLILEMNRKPARVDLGLRNKLWAEAPGILSWMLRGAVDWRAHGLVIPAAIKRATASYFDAEDVFAQWLAACCETGPRMFDTFDALWNSWQAFASDEGADPGSKRKTFPAELDKHGFKGFAHKHGIRGTGREGLQVRREKSDDDGEAPDDAT